MNIAKQQSQSNPDSPVDGAEEKTFFPVNEQASIISRIAYWYNKSKLLFPKDGFLIMVPRTLSGGTPLQSIDDISDEINLPNGIKYPREATRLFDAIIRDSLNYPELSTRKPRLIFERTGSKNTQPEDLSFHLDTSRIYWDNQGNRIKYSKKRSLDTYMIFVGRPGSVVVHGRVDPKINYPDSTAIGIGYRLSGKNRVITNDGTTALKASQFPSNTVYKVAVGDLFHRPPSHEDGLLITVRF